MSAIAQNLFDASIRRTVYLERFAVDVRRKVISLLNKAQEDIAKEVLSNDPTDPSITRYREQRLTNLSKRIDKILGDTYRQMNKETQALLKNLAGIEASSSAAVINTILGADLFNVTLTNDYLKSIVDNTLIDGQVIGKWYNAQAKNLSQKISRALAKEVHNTNLLQIGMTKGESVGKLVSLIKGTSTTVDSVGFALSRRDATTLVRTSVLQVANQARQALYSSNQDLMEGYQIVGTLDDRSCAYCAATDGRLYDLAWNSLDKGPGVGGPPPWHFNCRCSFIPLLKSYEKLVSESTPQSTPITESYSDLSQTQLGNAIGFMRSPEVYAQGLITGAMTEDREVYEAVLAARNWTYSTDMLQASSTVHLTGRVTEKFAGLVTDKSLEQAGRLLDMIQQSSMKSALYYLDDAMTLEKLDSLGDSLIGQKMKVNKIIGTTREVPLNGDVLFKIVGNKNALDIGAISKDDLLLTFGNFEVVSIERGGRVVVTLKQVERTQAISKIKLTKDQLRALDNLPESTRAAMGGVVPSNTTYDGWLKVQSETLQKEILGPVKWKIWKDNGLSMADLIDQSGRPLTIVELKEALEKGVLPKPGPTPFVAPPPVKSPVIEEPKKPTEPVIKKRKVSSKQKGDVVPEWKEISTIPQFNEGMKQYNLCKFNFISSDANIHVLNEVGRTFVELKKVAPLVPLKEFAIETMQNSSGTYATFFRRRGRITLNQSWFKSLDKINSGYSRDQRKVGGIPFHPFGQTNGVKATVAHEFGHVVDSWIDYAGYGPIARGGVGSIASRHKEWMADHFRDLQKVSRYSATNVREAFAECFSLLIHGDVSKYPLNTQKIIMKFKDHLDEVMADLAKIM